MEITLIFLKVNVCSLNLNESNPDQNLRHTGPIHPETQFYLISLLAYAESRLKEPA
jgi:hypothetical protein